MGTTFAAVIFRPADVSEEALSHGFGIATAGFDVARPTLLVAELSGLAGWSVAFYRGTDKPDSSAEEHEHACDLFDQELPPGLAVLGAAEKPDTVVYALVFSDEIIHDDACRFSDEDTVRRYLCEAEEGLEAGRQSGGRSEDTLLDLNADDLVLRPHRGSTFISEELGVAILPLLVRALFEADRRVPVRIVGVGDRAIARETRRLNRALRREDGRAAWTPPAAVASVATPAAYRAFVSAYDWADPRDPSDLYRELAIGQIQGTLYFYRESDLVRLGNDATWKQHASAGLFPIAALRASALGGAGKSERIVAIAPDEDELRLVAQADVHVAGPTFGELIAYLALGWSQRDAIEEDLIGALMLRAKIRAERAG